MEIKVIFTKNLEAIKFLDQDGNVVDPRIVLMAWVEGAATLEYEEMTHTPEYDVSKNILSQTWTILIEDAEDPNQVKVGL